MPNPAVRKKLIFFVHCTKITPSTRRRVLDYLPFLTDVEPVVLSYTSPYFYEKFHSISLHDSNLIRRSLKRIEYLVFGFLAYSYRVVSLFRLYCQVPKAQGAFIQKAVPPRWFSALLVKRNRNILFDFDDAIFLRSPKKTEAIVEKSKVVLAGSHYLLEYAQERNANSFLLPTPAPLHHFSAKDYSSEVDEQRIVIGWTGSKNTIDNLRILVEPFDRLGKKYDNLVFRIVGFANRRDLIPCFQNIELDLVSFVPYEQIPSMIDSFDIGVMPLSGSEWDKGKCVLKALEYMAAGVPAVLSDFGENAHIVQDGENGYLASTDSEWFTKMEGLIQDKNARKTIGLNGRKTIEEEYSTEKCCEKFVEALDALLESD